MRIPPNLNRGFPATLFAAAVLPAILWPVCIAFARVKLLKVEPSRTDPAITNVHGPNIAIYDPQAPDRHRLLLFIVGTGATALGSRRIDTVFAKWGYHAVSIDYNDNVIAVACAHSRNPEAFGEYRDAIVTGAPVCKLVHVTPADSIINRFQKMLLYLVKHDPRGGWGQFMKGGKPVWRNVIVAGHSQGSGHAAYLGKLFRVDRVLMFSGPQDFMDRYRRPAPWLSEKSATPPARFFSFLARKDPFNVRHQIANCVALMHLSKPATLMVQPGKTISPDRGIRILINNLPVKNPHGSTLLVRFKNVWKYMVTARIR